jgi:hypothetical protein
MRVKILTIAFPKDKTNARFQHMHDFDTATLAAISRSGVNVPDLSIKEAVEPISVSPELPFRYCLGDASRRAHCGRRQAS